MDDKRIKTGIAELDKIIGGGFLLPSVILVLGPPGSGKTTLSWQYLVEGAKHREKGMLFSTVSETSSSLIQFASNYWFVDSKLIGKKIFIGDLNEQINNFKTGEELIELINEKIMSLNIKRVVIDPINLIQLSITDIKKYRFFIFKFSNYIKEKKIHAIMTAELYAPNDFHCHEAFISDGTILLQTDQSSRKVLRNLTVVKMRGTHHELKPVEYIITKNGIELKLKK
ncbi:MAG: RAD55 family ATPase [Promethearchaeota archaeon]